MSQSILIVSKKQSNICNIAQPVKKATVQSGQSEKFVIKPANAVTSAPAVQSSVKYVKDATVKSGQSEKLVIKAANAVTTRPVLVK